MRKKGELLFYEPYVRPYLCAYGHGLKRNDVFDHDDEISLIWKRICKDKKKHFLKKRNGYVRLVRNFEDECLEYLECYGPKQGAMPVSWFEWKQDPCRKRLFDNTIFLIWFFFEKKKSNIYTCSECGKQIYCRDHHDLEFVTQFGCLKDWYPEIWQSMSNTKVNKLEVES